MRFSRLVSGLLLAGLACAVCVTDVRPQEKQKEKQDDKQKEKPKKPPQVVDVPFAKEMPLPKGVSWKLDALNQAPVKVVGMHVDEEDGGVSWVMELTRNLDVYEDVGYWAPAYKEGKRTRIRFELRDINGIVLKTVEGRYVGEYVKSAGKRFGIYLEDPGNLGRPVRFVEALAR